MRQNVQPPNLQKIILTSLSVLKNSTKKSPEKAVMKQHKDQTLKDKPLKKSLMILLQF